MKRKLHALSKRLPIEWFLIIAWAVVAAVLIWCVHLGAALAAAVFGKIFIFFYLFGGDFFLLCIGFIDFYLVARFIAMLLAAAMEGKLSAVGATARHIGRMILEYLFLILPLSLILLDAAMMIGVLDNYTAPARVFSVSNLLFGVDRAVFGTYPTFWLSHAIGANQLLDIVAVIAYKFLTPIMGVFLLYALLRKPAVARRFLLFFFVCQVLSAPVWFAVPAASPYAFYTGKVPQAEISAPVATALSEYHPSDRLQAEFAIAEKRSATAGSNYFDLTNLPSMHAAWGLGLVYFGAIALGVGAGYAFGAWFLLEILGAVYTGEHYGVDIIAGIAIAIIAFWVVEKILDFEKKRYAGKTSFALLDMMRADSERVKEFYGEFRDWTTKKLS